MIEVIHLYFMVCYFIGLVAFVSVKEIPLFMLVVAPCSVPVTIAFIYCTQIDGGLE